MNTETSNYAPDMLSEIIDTMQEKFERELKRFDVCGCRSCRTRARQLKHWLVPDLATANECPSAPLFVPAPERGLWQCDSCLRDVPAALVACPYCGTERFLAY
jgi:hypothetical protein